LLRAARASPPSAKIQAAPRRALAPVESPPRAGDLAG